MNHTKYRISSILSAHRYAGQRPTSSMGQSVCIRSGVAELNTPDLNTPAMESTTRMSTGRIMYAGPPRAHSTPAGARQPRAFGSTSPQCTKSPTARMAAAAAQIMVGRSFFPAPKYPSDLVRFSAIHVRPSGFGVPFASASATASLNSFKSPS